MAEPLAVVPALNTMIPLCTLLVFGTSVSRASLMIKVVSKSVLLALTALAWLSQPLSKIQGIVSHIWGHDTYVVIFGMDWWRMCKSIVDLGKGQMVVKREGKVHYLPLEPHNTMSDKITAIDILSHGSFPHKEIDTTQATINMFNPIQ